MKDKIHNLNEKDLVSSISRLSYFSPTTTDDYGNQIIDYLLLDSLSDFESTIITPKEVKNNINNNLLVTFEEDEIVSSARRLAQKKLIKVIEPQKRFDKPKIQILKKAEELMSSNKIDLNKLEQEVFETWKSEVKQKYDNHKDITDNINDLVDILQKFTSKMFVKHGVETVSLLYPGESKIKSWLNEDTKQFIEDIQPNTNPFFDNIIKIEIPRFFKSVDAKRNQYISNLFNSSFYWHLIQVDDKCSRLLQKVTKGQQLFLDNNILYSLVGLHGKDALESGHSMLKFANNLGYILVVSTKTVDEFQNTLKWHLNEAREKPPVSASLAKIALDELGEDNFITAYWKELVEKGISLEEFIAELSYLDDILDGLGIGISNKYRKDIEVSEELKDEMSLLRKSCGDHININIIEHDAFHRILITKIRKGFKYNFNEAKAWFLTHDHKLPQYSKHARKGKDHLPFCITTNEWIQINRPLLTRTKTQDEFEASFHRLVTQSYVRSMLPTIPLDKAYNKILGKLERFKGMTADAASRIASDTHFMISILNIDDDKELEEKIENRLLDLNKELRQQNEILILEKKAQESKAERLENKVENLSSELNETREAIESVQSSFEDKKEEYQEKIKKLENTILEKAKSVGLLNDQLTQNEFNEKYRKWKIPAYWSIIAVFILIGFILLVFFFQTKEWNKIASMFSWIEEQSEMRKEIFKWLLLIVLGILQFLSLKIIWKRLIDPNAKSNFEKR